MEIRLEKPERHPLVQSMTVVFHLEKKKRSTRPKMKLYPRNLFSALKTDKRAPLTDPLGDTLHGRILSSASPKIGEKAPRHTHTSNFVAAICKQTTLRTP